MGPCKSITDTLAPVERTNWALPAWNPTLDRNDVPSVWLYGQDHLWATSHLVSSPGEKYPHLSELCVGDQPFITNVWECYGSKVTLHGSQASFLMAKTPLSIFYDQTAIEESANVELESVHPNPSFFDLAETDEELRSRKLTCLVLKGTHRFLICIR